MRGGQTRYCGVELVWDVQQLWVHISTLSSAVSLSMKLFFPVHPAERFCAEWGGEGDVDQGVFARAYLEDTTRAVLSWNSFLRSAYVGCPDGNWKSPGEWLGPGEGLPLIDVPADVESGALGWCWPNNTAPQQYEALATWLRPRLS